MSLIYAAAAVLEASGGLRAPYQHIFDAVTSDPQTSTAGHTADTGRAYAYDIMDLTAGPAVGQCSDSWYQTYIQRVAAWLLDQTIYTGGVLPGIVIPTSGNPSFSGPFNVNWGGTGESVTGPTQVFNRSGYFGSEGLLPTGTPLTPGSDLDYALTAADFVSRYSFALNASLAFHYPASLVLHGPNDDASYFPMEFIYKWDATSSQPQFGGGWTSIYPKQLIADVATAGGTFAWDGSQLAFTFEANDCQFGGSGKVKQVFLAFGYVYTFGSGTITTPTQGIDPGSYTGTEPFLVKPDPAGSGPYFTYPDPISGDPCFDQTTGRMTHSSIPMKMP